MPRQQRVTKMAMMNVMTDETVTINKRWIKKKKRTQINKFLKTRFKKRQVPKTAENSVREQKEEKLF